MSVLDDYLLERRGGEWDLLATAAGAPDALRISLEGLSEAALQAHSNGPAISFSIVHERVNAVAAWDKSLLDGLAATWINPELISLDPYDSAADFWMTAWATSMRFLARRHPWVTNATGRLPRPIELEREILRRRGPDLRGYQQLAAFLSAPECNLRCLDDSSIQLDTPLTMTKLAQLPGWTKVGQPEDFSLLRIFFGRPQLLDPSASSCLRREWDEWWFSLKELPLPGGWPLVLLDLLLELYPRDDSECETWHRKVVEHLIFLLEKIDLPLQAAPLIYLLCGRGWRCP